MRVSGIGTMWLGASKRDADDCVHATVAFAPVLPLRRCRLQLLPHQGSGFAYRELACTPLSGREILGTVLFCYVAVPLLLFGPMVPAIEEVRQKIGIPQSWQMPMIVVSILWMVIFVWKLSDWHEERFHVSR